MKIELNRDWSEFLCALIGRRVRFVLIGGHAVAGHGEPRFTEDLDVFVEPTLANARRLRAALADFGFGESHRPSAVVRSQRQRRRAGSPARTSRERARGPPSNQRSSSVRTRETKTGIDLHAAPAPLCRRHHRPPLFIVARALYLPRYARISGYFCNASA